MQGGIDPGETPEEAAVRELYEEVGLEPGEYTILAGSDTKYRYDWPTSFLSKLKSKKYRGQEQQYFLIQVKPETQFKLDTYNQEFASVRWGTVRELLDLAWDQKRPGLEGALREFGLLT